MGEVERGPPGAACRLLSTARLIVCLTCFVKV